MDRRRSRRSRRSYVVEGILIVVGMAAIWAFLNLGGAEAFGHWIGPQFAPHP